MTPTTTCKHCGKPTSGKRAKTCRECYYKRVNIPSIAAQWTCNRCGKPVSSSGTKICIDCYRNRGHTAPTQLISSLTSFEEAWARWSKAIGRRKDRYTPPPKKPEGRERIVVIPDIHAPYHDRECLVELIKREKGRASKVILIGDVSDAYSFSTFLKYDRMSFQDEWAEVTAVMQVISESFPSVEVIIGNHDARLEKRLRHHLTEDMVDAVKYMTRGILCPLTALVKRYPNVSIARHEVPGTTHSIDWFTTCGDAWLGHPEKFSKVPGSSLRAVEDWLLDQETALSLDRYRLIIMGHTHQLAMIPFRSSSLLVECGCLCATQSYQLSPRIMGRPQKRGYVWFEQDNGVTDLNSVGMHWFDVE
jgi:predicted phosphodiesterase